jgi:hypothetical protein
MKAAALPALPFLVHHLLAVSIDRLPTSGRLRFTGAYGASNSSWPESGGRNRTGDKRFTKPDHCPTENPP